MTWILAQPNLFGQVLALSDIQVTFTDSKGNKLFRDCLQKMYAFDNNFIIGFAGNVYGGLTLLGKFSKALNVENQENNVPEPEILINSLAEYSKKLFNNLIDAAKFGGLHLLMAGVSPTKDLGIPGMGKPVVAVLKSPDFKPIFGKIGEWSSIGSGSEVENYKRLLEKLSGDKTFPLAQMEVHSPGGFASTLGITLIIDIQKETAQKGISKHFHVAIVTRNDVWGGNSDHTEHLGELAENKIQMPTVATNLTEFENFVKKEFGTEITACG